MPIDTARVLDAPRANALLRCMTCDGRLHPGLAPPLRGAVTGTEERLVTPPEEVREVRGKMLMKMVEDGYIDMQHLRK